MTQSTFALPQSLVKSGRGLTETSIIPKKFIGRYNERLLMSAVVYGQNYFSYIVLKFILFQRGAYTGDRLESSSLSLFYLYIYIYVIYNIRIYTYITCGKSS